MIPIKNTTCPAKQTRRIRPSRRNNKSYRSWKVGDKKTKTLLLNNLCRKGVKQDNRLKVQLSCFLKPNLYFSPSATICPD